MVARYAEWFEQKKTKTRCDFQDARRLCVCFSYMCVCIFGDGDSDQEVSRCKRACSDGGESVPIFRG